MMNRADRWTTFYAAAMNALLARTDHTTGLHIFGVVSLMESKKSWEDLDRDRRLLVQNACELANDALNAFDSWVELQEAESGPNPFAKEDMPEPVS